MLSNPASGSPNLPNSLHPVLQSFARECHGLLARLLGYVIMLALVAIAAQQMFSDDRLDVVTAPVAPTTWSTATHSRPAFALNEVAIDGKTVAYEVLRHPDGSRRDVIALTDEGAVRTGEIELLRPGADGHTQLPAAEIAARMDPGGLRPLVLEAAVETKFGTITLLGFGDRPAGAPNCLGFSQGIAGANLRISGWSCDNASIPALRTALVCMLDGLTLLSAGNDAALAGAFARAELKRGGCGAPAIAAIYPDWATGAPSPLLRGAL